MADGEAECNLTEGHSGGKMLGELRGFLLVAAKEVEREEFRGERVFARFLPRESASRVDPNGKDADSELAAGGQQVAEVRFRKFRRHLAPRTRIEQVIRRLYRLELAAHKQPFDLIELFVIGGDHRALPIPAVVGRENSRGEAGHLAVGRGIRHGGG